MSVARSAVKRPVTTIMIYIAISLLGVIAWTRMPQELFPSITYPQISVVTRYKDAAPEEIELLVTNPIEEVAGTVPGVHRISSISKEEVSLIIAEFTWGTNMDFAALGVREKLDLVKERLPRGAEDPVVIKYNPFELPAMVLNVSGPYPPYELVEICRRQIKDVLEKVEGVASINMTGGVEREILVEVDQGRLAATGTSIVGISEALSKANLNYPAGTIKEAFYEYLIRTMGEFKVVPEIKEIAVNVEEDDQPRRDRREQLQQIQRQKEQPLQREKGVHPSPRLVLLRDVAVVKDTFKERTSISRYNGQENISLAVQKQSGENTVQVVTRVRKALDQLKPSLPAGVEIHVASDQSVAIRQAVRGVVDAAWQGALLASLVLVWFLRNPWVALNVTAAIPLSILVTLGCMYFSDVSINVISMGGLALGVGLLVDAGIVVVENVDRHRAMGKPAKTAAIEGTEEVGGALGGTILTTIVPFIPLIFVYGLVGQLFKDLAFTVTFSNLASWAVSVTLTPLLASRIRAARQSAPTSSPGAAPGEEGLVRHSWLSRQELKLVKWFLNHPWLGIALVVGSFVVSVGILRGLPQEFLPKVDQGQFVVKLEMPPGTRLQVTDRIVHRVEERMRAHPAVKDVTVNIGSTKGQGGAELIGTRGPHQAQLLVGLRPREERKLKTAEVVQQIRSALGTAPLEGALLEFILEESALNASALANAPVVIEVRGDQLPVLESLAKTVEEELRSIPGLYSITTSLIPPSPETKVRILKDRAATYHLTVSDIALTAQTAVKGFVATKFKEGGREYDVRVRLREADRRDLGKVRRLTIRSPLQMTVPLADVAYLAVGHGPTEIKRQDRERVVVVSANLFQRKFGDVMEDVTAMLNRLQVPPKYEVKVAGEQEEMQQSFQSLIFAAVLAFILVYMVMAATFESLWQPFLIMATIPMSLIGVAGALWITQTPVSAMVGLGVMLLGGIVVDNGIVLIDFVNQLQRERGVPLYDALLQASQTRFRPIFMTATSTVLGALPLAIGFTEGAELQGPMGVTIMGGLISATFLTLVFLPTVFLVSDRLLTQLFPRRILRPEPEPEPAEALVPAMVTAGVLAEGPPAFAPELMTPAVPLEESPTVIPEPVSDLPSLPELTPPEPIESPEIPEDYGREDAVPETPAGSFTPWMASLEIPEPAVPEPTPAEPPPSPVVTPSPPRAPEPLLLTGPQEGGAQEIAHQEEPPLSSAVPAPEPQPLALNRRQRWLLETLKTVGRMSRKDYAVQTGASIPTAARDLKELVDAGLIRGVGPLGPGRVYELMNPPAP